MNTDLIKIENNKEIYNNRNNDNNKQIIAWNGKSCLATPTSEEQRPLQMVFTKVEKKGKEHSTKENRLLALPNKLLYNSS